MVLHSPTQGGFQKTVRERILVVFLWSFGPYKTGGTSRTQVFIYGLPNYSMLTPSQAPACLGLLKGSLRCEGWHRGGYLGNPSSADLDQPESLMSQKPRRVPGTILTEVVFASLRVQSGQMRVQSGKKNLDPETTLL